MSPECFKVYQTERTNSRGFTNEVWLTCREEGKIVIKRDQQGIPDEILRTIERGHIRLNTASANNTHPLALFAYEIENLYCILAIATTEQDDVYYRYFWLSLDDFDQQTDGILTLTNFCSENNWPTYDQKPNDVEWKLPENWPTERLTLDSTTFQNYLSEKSDLKNYLEGIDGQVRPFLAVFENDLPYLYLHCLYLYFAALKLSQNKNHPIAWVWYVRAPLEPNRFLAINFADEFSYQCLSQQLGRVSPTPCAIKQPEHKDRNISTLQESNTTQESDGESSTQPGTSPSLGQPSPPVLNPQPEPMVIGPLNNQSSNDSLVHEFCRGFTATEKDGIWVSGGFKSNKIDRPTHAVPESIKKAITDGWLKIPDDDFPLPGAVALLEQEAAKGSQRGDILIKPPSESIAVIARKIDRYCILAIATTYLDNTPGMRQMVSYQYYWLSLDKLQDANPDPKKQVDGILSLIDWWQGNGSPCFNMDPNGQRSYPYKLHIRYVSLSPHDPGTLTDISYIETHPDLSPPILLPPSQERSIYLTHQLALRVIELYDVPLAWAWNVRNLTAPVEFAVIHTADSNAFDHLVSKKQKLPKKSRFEEHPSEEPPPPDRQLPRPHSTGKPSTPSGTSTHPDSLSLDDLNLAIENYTSIHQPYGALPNESTVFHKCFLRLLESFNHRFIPKISNNPHVLALKEVLDIYLDICRSNHSREDNNWHDFYASKLAKFGGDPEFYKYPRHRHYLILFTLLLVNVRCSPPDLPEGTQNYWATLRRLLSEQQPFKSSVVEYLKNLEQATHPLEKQLEYQSICKNLKARIYQLLHPQNDNIAPPQTSSPGDPLVPIILLIMIVASIIITVPLFLSKKKACADMQDNWSEMYIEELIKQKKIPIPIKGKCRPNEPINRADLTNWLKATFPDFDAALLTREQSPVSRIEVLEIINRNVTRTKSYQYQEEISKLLPIIYFESDLTNIPKEEKAFITIVMQQGLIINYPNPCLFEPKANATRAEVAAMLYFSKNPTAIPSYPQLNFQQLLCYGLQLEVSERDANQIKRELQKQLQEDATSNQPMITLLIPGKLNQEQLKKLPILEPGMTSESDIIFSLKNMFRNFPYKQGAEHHSYPVDAGEINNEFDADFEQYIKELQGLRNIKPITGNIASKTWQELSEYFLLVNAEEARQHLVNGLQSNASLVDLIEELRGCQVQDPLKYQKCLKQKSSSRNSRMR